MTATQRYCARCRTWHRADLFGEHLCQTPEDGHRFRLTMTSAGSYGVVGEPGKTDSDWWGPEATLTVRAWNLRDALRLAAAQPLAAWSGLADEETVDGFTCPRCGRTSHHPEDLRHGYCGACHAFTGEPQP